MEEATPVVRPKAKVATAAALALFLFALLFRFVGIGWGLKNDLHNQSYHPDEPLIFAVSQAIEPAKGKFTPGYYSYGTLYFTALRVASDFVTVYTGGPDPKSMDSYWAWVSRCHLAGRILSAFAGAGTVLVLFYILRRLTGLFGAVFGALLLAVSPAFVVHSRFQTVDVAATFFIALSSLYALRLLRRPGEEALSDREALKAAVLSGVFAGLSAGTKYTGILALATLFVAIALAKRRDFVKLAVLGLVASVLAFVVSTPGVLLDSDAFWTSFRQEMALSAEGHGLIFVGTTSGFLYHIVNLFFGLGPILTVMGVLGLGYGAWKRQPWALALGAFFLLYYVLIGRAESKFLRYTFPLEVGLAAGFGYLVGGAQRRVGGSGRTATLGRLVVAAGIAGLGGIDMGGMVGAVRMTSWMAGEDPRDTAGRYIKSQSASNPASTVGLASDPWYWTPAVYPDAALIRSIPLEKRLEELAQTSQPHVVYHVTPGEAPHNFDVRLLTQDRPDRVAMSSFEFYDPIRIRNLPGLAPDERAQADQADQFQRELGASYVLERQYATDWIPIHDLEYIHPEVLVWKRRDLP